MNNQPTNTATFFETNRMLLKSLMIGFLILVTLIPIALLHNLVTERQQRQVEVAQEISSKWASDQTLVGPVMLLPYLSRLDSTKAPVKQVLYLLPETLDIDGKMLTEQRHRSIYDVTLYRSQISLNGVFDPAYIRKLGIRMEDILWNDAHLILGLNDARGLEDDVRLTWDKTVGILEAGVPENSVIEGGLSSKVNMMPETKTSFGVTIKLKGSSHLYFTPVGKVTTVKLTSPWKNPAFDGQFLPSTPARITDSGFIAQWRVLQASRSYPQAWLSNTKYDVSKSSFGLKLLQPTDGYANTERSVKYAILVIALTFAVFFLVETFQKRQIHPLQYILVGVALCVFYTLLLSITEYTGFNIAYLIASIATVSLIGLYVLSIFKKASVATGFTAALSGLYAYIYILIQLQDYALLYGSIGLFVIIAAIMYASRNINWYNIHLDTTNSNEHK